MNKSEYAALGYDHEYKVPDALIHCMKEKTSHTDTGNNFSVLVISKCSHLEALADMKWLERQNDKLIGEKVALQTQVKELKKGIELLTQKNAH